VKRVGWKVVAWDEEAYNGVRERGGIVGMWRGALGAIRGEEGWVCTMLNPRRLRGVPATPVRIKPCLSTEKKQSQSRREGIGN